MRDFFILEGLTIVRVDKFSIHLVYYIATLCGFLAAAALQ